MMKRARDWLVEHAIRVVDNRRVFAVVVVTSVAIVCAGFAVAVAAIVIGSGADDRALAQVRRDAAADADRARREAAAADLRTCRIGNVTRPQIAVNTLVIVDGVLRGLNAPIEVRRAAARGAIVALDEQLARDGSAGPRDCNHDDEITRADYPPKVGPQPILGDNGLPRGATP